jgi:hypothetical protein
METQYRLKYPEEIELESKLAELERLKQQHAATRDKLAKLRIELRMFERVYDQVLGKRIAELDRLEALLGISESSTGSSSGNGRQHLDGEWTGHLHADGLFPNESETTEDVEQRKLKALYREVAKAIHPDLSVSEDERVRRQELMTIANRAYKEDDLEALQKILHEWDCSPEKIRGQDIGAELVKVIRLVAKERDRIAEVEAQIDLLMSTDSYLFKRRVDDSLAKGIDLLAEMAATVDLNIATARRRLATKEGDYDPYEGAEGSTASRIIRFPLDANCGILYTRKRESVNYCDWQKLCIARGTRTIPAIVALRLDVRGDAGCSPRFLKELHPDDLQSLFLYAVNDVILGFCSHLRGLEEIFISDSLITDSGLVTLSLLSSIKRVYLYHTDITDAGLSHLYPLENLEQFTCSGTKITDAGLEQLQRAVPGIKTLDFPWRYGRK